MYSSENKRNTHVGVVRISLAMAYVAIAGCCICPSESLSPWDDELSGIVESNCSVKVCDSSEDFYANTYDLVSLASRLETICISRNISRSAVSGAMHMKPFAYDDKSIAYALVKQGFFVDGIEFEFDCKGRVIKVRPFHVVL